MCLQLFRFKLDAHCIPTAIDFSELYGIYAIMWRCGEFPQFFFVSLSLSRVCFPSPFDVCALFHSCDWQNSAVRSPISHKCYQWIEVRITIHTKAQSHTYEMICEMISSRFQPRHTIYNLWFVFSPYGNMNMCFVVVFFFCILHSIRTQWMRIYFVLFLSRFFFHSAHSTN